MRFSSARMGATGVAAPESTHTRPVAPPARGWAALGTWFEAPTPHGPLQLYLGEPGGPAAHAPAAALALQRASTLLDPLDDWLGEAAPDWRWQPETTTQRGPTMLRLPWRDSCHQLIAPWRWLRALPPPPEVLAEGLQWPAIEAVLAIARMGLRADELQQLEPGGAVLLPASMKPGWTGRLRAAHESEYAGVAVQLDDLARPRVLPGAAPSLEESSGAGRVCELRLNLRGTLPARSLTGWQADALQDALSPDLAATLWQQPAGREPARCLAQGRLLPWGDGWALLVDGLGERVTDAAGDRLIDRLGDGLGDGLDDGLGDGWDSPSSANAEQAHVSAA